MNTHDLKHMLHWMLAKREVQLDDDEITGQRREAIDREADAIEEALDRLGLIDDELLAEKKGSYRRRCEGVASSRRVAA